MAKVDPKDEALMRELSKVALEQALQICADKARWAAEECPSDMNGRDALLSFANAIVSTNAKVWPTGGKA